MIKAPTPFQIVGKGVKSVGKSIGKALSKASGKIMGPTVKGMKLHDAKMQEMSKKAKSGEFNR